jgi:hypothetical protein
MSPGSVVSIVALDGGGGAGEPTEGMSPAKADDEKTHARANVIRSRFTSFSPLVGMQDFLHRGE